LLKVVVIEPDLKNNKWLTHIKQFKEIENKAFTEIIMTHFWEKLTSFFKEIIAVCHSFARGLKRVSKTCGYDANMTRHLGQSS
jgi:hypothetical protein